MQSDNYNKLYERILCDYFLKNPNTDGSTFNFCLKKYLKVPHVTHNIMHSYFNKKTSYRCFVK